MSVRSGESITKTFTTRVFATGVGTNADSLPTGVLYVNGVANGATVTVANLATGKYTAAVTLPTLALNDVVEIMISATVSTIADAAVIWCDTKDVFAGAIPDVAAGGTNGLFIAGTNAATTITTSLTTHLVGTVDTVTTVTNQLTAAAIATGIWQDATAGDFTTSSSIGKSLFNAFTVAGGSVFTTAALANAPTGGSAPTVAQIATGVWQDVTSGDFTVSGSIGASLFTSGNAPGAASGLALVGSNVVASTVSDKTGYALSSAGLDQISVADPGPAAGWTTFPKIMVALYRRFFKKFVMTATLVDGYADDNTTLTSHQAVSNDGITQTQGPAS